MSHELKEGQQIEMLDGPIGPDKEPTPIYVVGEKRYPHQTQVREIVVAEQAGHMSMIAWFKIVHLDGSIELRPWEGVTCVLLAKDKPDA